MTRTQEQQDAIAAAFTAATSEAADLAQQLAYFMSEHMEQGPDSIHWGHVGDANRVVSKLKELMGSEGLGLIA